MLYKFDDLKLEFKAITHSNIALRLTKLYGPVVLVIIFGLSVFGYWLLINIIEPKKPLKESEIQIIVLEHNKFSEEKLTEMIKSLHFNFPYIVYAQALLESNHFKSKIFLENNNILGMREATMRINLAKGTQNNYACYNSWSESVYDYALYSATYLSSLHTEEDYYNYLSHSYAEDTSYIRKLKIIINQQNLKLKFQ
jgi:hypothetical protein